MIELAPALRPFVSELAIFEDDVRGGIGPWLLPLQRALGAMRIPRHATAGEPDGFAGLTRRGPYDRLLASEWLLALDEPDEFLRRAIMNEHVFLAPQYREPGGACTSVALLDTGPLQLGAPRLVQLALLVVLARRAAAARAELRFGVLQDEHATLHELDPPGVLRWLNARSWLPAAHAIDAWRERLTELAAEDAWIVGAPSVRAIADSLRTHCVTVAELDESTIEVHTHPRDQVGEVARLATLAPEVAVKTLRQPIRPLPRPARATALDHTGGLGRLSWDGRRLLLIRADRTCDAFHVPNSPRERAGRTKHIGCASAFTLLGADVYDGRAVSLVAHTDELAIGGSGLALRPGGKATRAAALRSLGTYAFTGLRVPDAFRNERLGELHVVAAGLAKFRAWFVDPTAQLWELEIRLDGEGKIEASSLELRDRQCKNFTQLGREMVCWASAMLGTAVTLPKPGEWELDDPELDTCLFSRCFSDDQVSVAYARGEDWIIHSKQRVELMRPPGEVFGIEWRYRPTTRPLLLVVDPNRREVRRRDDEVDEVVLVAPDKITAIRYEPASRRILYICADGQRVVFDLDLGAVVWRSVDSEVRTW